MLQYMAKEVMLLGKNIIHAVIHCHLKITKVSTEVAGLLLLCVNMLLTGALKVS